MDAERSERGMQIRDVVRESVIELKRHASSKTAKQTATLYASQILLIVFGIVTSFLNTRVLGPTDYGVLTFFGTVTGFTVLFFRFGLFSAGGLLLAKEKNLKRGQQLIGALVLLCIGIGLSFALFIFCFSYFIDQIFHTNVRNILRILSPLLIIMPFSLLIPQIGRGTNKITTLAFYNVIPRVCYVTGLLVLLYIVHVNVTMLLFLNLCVTIIAVVTIMVSFKPSMDNLGPSFKKIWSKTKEYGFNLYLGQIASQSTYKLDGIFITYFVNTTQLGFYFLSTALTSPMVILSQSLSTSLFKGFTETKRIPKSVIYFNFIWLSVSLLGLILFGRIIVVLLFTDNFLPVVPLILPLALANFFRGLKQPYNIYLNAHGKGVFLRNSAFTVAGVNLLGNATLIPVWGVWGAALATLFGQIFAFGMHLMYYRQAVAE